jgi:predicted AAA+ superfamily ATPase
LIIYGPRRVGKTTLLKEYFTKSTKTKLLINGDDIKIRQLFLSQDRDSILDFAKNYEFIAIDEAQQIPNIGLGIKMIIDEFPDKEIILTGSSSFELAQQTGEPLTGRHFTMLLLPFSVREIGLSNFELKNNLENLLIYGNYPNVLTAENNTQKKKILEELISSYLFKDVLMLDKVKSPDTLLSICKALAFQIGQEVSFTEISKLVKADVKTVQRYIDILEKMFVVKKVKAYSKNMRNEIAKKNKFYFLDLGVRNALIDSYGNFENRNDVGQLFENFVFNELYKKSNLKEDYSKFFFWRTFTGQEIDIIVETEGDLFAFECKFSKDHATIPALWKEYYSEYEFKIINKNNFTDFI